MLVKVHSMLDGPTKLDTSRRGFPPAEARGWLNSSRKSTWINPGEMGNLWQKWVVLRTGPVELSAAGSQVRV